MSTHDDLETAWQALTPKQREWLAEGPEFLRGLPGRTVRLLRLSEPPIIEVVPGGHRRTPWGVEVSEYIRERPARTRVWARGVCKGCGRELDVLKSGGFRPHYTPDDRRCEGGGGGLVSGRVWQGEVASVWAQIPAPVHALVQAAARSLEVECRDVAAEALARLTRRWCSGIVEAREIWRVPDRLAVPTVRAQDLTGPTKAVCWSLPAPGVEALDAWVAGASARTLTIRGHKVEVPGSRSKALRLALWALLWDGEGVPPWA